MTALYGKHNNDSNQKRTMALDDSIEEMTSMLIDDTTMNQLTGEPGKHLSKLGSGKVLPQSSRQGFFHDKALPRLPRLSFDGGDEWAATSRPAIAAVVGVSTNVDMIDDEEDFDSFPPPVSRHPAHARKSSAPPPPRKSSKRRPRQREPKEFAKAGNTTSDESRQLKPRRLSKMTQQIIRGQFFSSGESAKAVIPRALVDATQKIEAMLAASKALKPEGDNVAINSPGQSKNSGKKGSSVLSKMRNAIAGHLSDNGLQNYQNLGNSEHLPVPNLSQLPDYEEEASTISVTELSEG